MTIRANTTETAPRWVTLGRASEILGVDESTLRRWADSGRVRAYRTPGGHRRFSLLNLEEMLAGDGKHRSSDDIERLAVAKIRRQIQRARQEEDGWYAALSDSDRHRLRELGRRLVEMIGEYMDKRGKRAGLLDEAYDIGESYGRVLHDASLQLQNAIGAYVSFRKTLDETTRQIAHRDAMPMETALETADQVHALGDQVLRGLASAYSSAAPEAPIAVTLNN